MYGEGEVSEEREPRDEVNIRFINRKCYFIIDSKGPKRFLIKYNNKIAFFLIYPYYIPYLHIMINKVYNIYKGYT